MNGAYFESAELSDVGRKRKNNEDACLRVDAHGVFCVADGMGGQMCGDIASETIITTLEEVFGKTTPEEDNTLSKRISIFRAATNRASKWIKNFADEKVIGQMGSTIVALIIDPRDPRRGVGMHAGDSRLYRYRKGDLQQITVDHSAVNAMAAKLGIPVEKVPAKYQNELLRAVGLSETVELEKTPVDISSDDIFLICSDGLSKMLPDSTIAKLIKDSLQSGVQSIAQTLIRSANEAGGKDNVTAIIIKALDLSTAPRPVDADDEEKTPIPPEDLLAKISPPTPVPAAETPRPDSDDIRGDTPQTPITSDLTVKKDVEKPTPSEKMVDPVTPVQTESPTHFITRQMVTPPKAAPKAPATPPERDTPTTQKGGFPVAIIIGIVALVAAGAGIWFVTNNNSNKPSPAVSAPSPPAKPVAVATTPPPAPPAPASPSPLPAQSAYTDALKNAQASWAAGDFKNAAAYAALALQKMPGDATATKLAADAQAQLKIQEGWRNAFVNGRNAYNNGDYKNAVAWADEALKYIPNEKTATQLRDGARQKLSAQAATDEKYQTALRAAQAALKKGDVSTANQQAQEMLAVRPNDAAAQEILKQGSQLMDYESAQHAYDESDYDYAQQICQNYSSIPSFQQLAQKAQSEQATLKDDQNRLDSGDYSFTASLQSQPLARKSPFAKLLAQATLEQGVLNQLQSLKNAGNWQAASKIMADPANATLINKPPFRALSQWASSSSSQAQSQVALQQANVTFEEMLVWFNIKRPTDPYIQTPEAKKQTRYDGQLEDRQRQEYLATIARLETVFASSGQLNQNNRAKLLKELEDTVAHHE